MYFYLIRRVQQPDPPHGARRSASGPHLTPRQAQIMRYIEQALSNKEIALRLGIGARRPNGIYFLRLRSEDGRAGKPMKIAVVR